MYTQKKMHEPVGNEEFYNAYCKVGSSKYTDENQPKGSMDENSIWNQLSEIREVFKKYPCERIETPNL